LQYDKLEFVFSIGMFIIALFYWISSFQAVSYHNSVLTVFIYFFYAAFFLMALSLVTTKMSRFAAEGILFISSYAIVLYGLLVSLGNIADDNAIWFTNESYRLSSVFEYPNTYAGFLLALLLCATFSAVNTNRTIVSVFHTLMLVPIWISLLLTLSRGALVLVPILVLIILVFFRLGIQIAYIVTILISAAAAFFISGPLMNLYIKISQHVMPQPAGNGFGSLPIRDPASLKGWLMLTGTSIALTIIVLAIRATIPWLERRLASLAKRRFSPLFLPVTGTATGILVFGLLLGTNLARKILPQSIADRLANINFRQHSVLERMTFYRDALKVSADYPLFGTGGGGWTALYEQYQNNPYVSRQAHSFFFQTLVEIGWIGSLILIILVSGIFFIYLKNYWKERVEQPGHFIFFILTISILTHSLIDFDMSFVYIGALVFFTLGILAAVYRDKWSFSRLSVLNHVRWRYVYPVLLAIMSVTMFLQVFQEYAGAQLYRQALHMAVEERRPFEEILVPLDQAIAYSPAHPAYAYTKIEWLSQAYRSTSDRSYAEQAQTEIRRIKHFEPYDRQILLAEYRNYKDLQSYKQAMAVLEEGISKFPWDIKFYEAAIMEYAVNGQNAKDTDPNQAQTYWNRGLELLDEVVRRKQLLELLPEEQFQGRDFDLTPFIRQAAGQILYGQSRYEDAASMLMPVTGLDFSDVYVRIGVRYYLAALHKMGQSDEELENRLINADPNERMYLHQLAQ